MTVEKDWEKSALDTPHLEMLLDATRKKAPNVVEKAREELEALKQMAADEYLQNYCEIYGVPKGCEDWTPAQLQVWVRVQQQEGL